MPGVLPDMNATESAVSSPADATNRRRSGRTVKQPVLYQEDPNISISTNGVAKRKRAQRVDEEGQNTEEDDENGASSDDGEPGEDELRANKKKAKKGPRKPAAKRVKTAQSEAVTLAMRPAPNGVKKSSKSKPEKQRARVSMSGSDGTGLYGKVATAFITCVAKMPSAEVFLHGGSTDDVAANWIEGYKLHNANAMTDLVNFVLKCTGCDAQLEVHDIEDPDNAPNKLTDLQEEYQRQKIVDYPLISRAKSPFSRAILEDFLESLIQTAHASGILHDDVVFIENIMVWITAMSSSVIRPFRHTATVALTAIATAFCNIVKELANNIATTTRQKDGEAKRKSVNKGRVTALKDKIEENETKKQGAQGWMLDIFDTVFVHRYRDVDPRIRVDCAAALGTWILTCPDVFFEGAYLRYLGWLLSDHQKDVRSEVIKQLLKLYEDSENLGRLRAFTERFRTRLVEIAAQDAEPTVRALAVELLDEIREMGLLEPNDIDSIGRLIFDSEVRVRKAIAPFFAANVDDSYEAVVEELGGEEGLEEAVGEEPENDNDSPHRSWLKFKCTAELLDSYDLEDSPDNTPAPGVESVIHWGNAETRYTMAAQVVYEGVEEVRDWEMLSGYLLYDISTASTRRSTTDPLDTFKQRCQLTEKQEKLLLEVLYVAAKTKLTEAMSPEATRKGKRSKAQVEEAREIQESTALHLVQLLPRLLRKFGANPAAASAVLRLGRILDLEVFQELRQDSTEFDSLLDDINKQFLSHADRNVLAEASGTLLHASTFEDLEEVTESKLQDLWEKTTATLRQNVRAKVPQMKTIASTVHRILRLANISDPTDAFLNESQLTIKSKAPAPLKIIYLLIRLINEYASVEDPDADAIIVNAANSLLAFYMWTVRSIQEKAANNEAPNEVPGRTETVSALTQLISDREKLDVARLSAIGTLLEIHTLFATFRHAQVEDEDLASTLAALAEEISPQAQESVLSSFVAAERQFARKIRRPLEEAADDELPDDPEGESDEQEDEDADEAEKLRRRQEVLLAEKRLCELAGKMVLAIVSRVLDATGENKGRIRKRLIRNRTKLGPNFRDVLAYLEEPKAKRSHKAKGKAAAAAAPAGNSKAATSAKSAEIVHDEDDDEGVQELEEDGEEDLRRRELVDDLPEDEEVNGEKVVADEGGGGEEDAEDEIMGD